MSSAQLTLFGTPDRPRATGYVYYGTDGHDIKIGYTTSPVRRGGELKLTMLYTMPGTVEDERAHHQMWMRHRIIGTEWFRADRRLLEWLDQRVAVATHARAALRMLIFRPG